jgi:hypothetical protein
MHERKGVSMVLRPTCMSMQRNGWRNGNRGTDQQLQAHAWMHGILLVDSSILFALLLLAVLSCSKLCFVSLLHCPCICLGISELVWADQSWRARQCQGFDGM